MKIAQTFWLYETEFEEYVSVFIKPNEIDRCGNLYWQLTAHITWQDEKKTQEERKINTTELLLPKSTRIPYTYIISARASSFSKFQNVVVVTFADGTKKPGEAKWF